MKNNISIKDVRNYLGSNIVISMVPFLLLPLITRYLTVEEYALVGLFMAVSKFFSSTLDLNSNTALLRLYYNSETKNYTNYLTVSFIIITSMTFIYLLVISNYQSFFSEVLKLKIEYVLLAILSGFASVLIKIRLSQWQIRERSLIYSLFQVFQSLFFILFILMLVVYLHIGAAGRIYAELIVLVTFATIGLFTLFKENLIRFKKVQYQDFKDVLNYGIPLLPHVLGIFILSFADRFIVSQYLGLKDAGIYIISMQLSLGLTLFIDALNKAYVPWFYKSLSGFKNFKTIKGNQIKFYIMISLSIPLSFLFTGDVFAFLFGERYRAVSEVFPYIITAQVFSAFYIYQANYLLFFKKNLTLSAITIFSGVVYLLLLSYLTQAHGMVGAGSSFIIAMLVRYCITSYFSTRSFNEYKSKMIK